MRTPWFKNRLEMFLAFIILPVIFLLAACQDQSPPVEPSLSLGVSVTPSKALLTPYHTPTATSTPLPPDPATNTPFPTPTATPRTHIVQRGEDMFGIAWQYGITLAELQTANPDVNPNLLSVDTVLTIPASSQITPTSEFLPSPTPAGAVLGETVCYPAGDGGLWCFTQVTNTSSRYIEGVSLDIRLGSNGVQKAVGSALTVQNLIAPGAVLPAAVYFAPPIPASYETDASIITSLPVVNLSERYLSAGVEDLSIHIAADGKSAAVEGKAVFHESGSASLVSVAAVAYNREGDVIGFRRWEDSQPGSVISFSMQVYSLAGEIDQITVFAEAPQ